MNIICWCCGLPSRLNSLSGSLLISSSQNFSHLSMRLWMTICLWPPFKVAYFQSMQHVYRLTAESGNLAWLAWYNKSSQITWLSFQPKSVNESHMIAEPIKPDFGLCATFCLSQQYQEFLWARHLLPWSLLFANLAQIKLGHWRGH